MRRLNHTRLRPFALGVLTSISILGLSACGGAGNGSGNENSNSSVAVSSSSSIVKSSAVSSSKPAISSASSQSAAAELPPGPISSAAQQSSNAPVSSAVSSFNVPTSSAGNNTQPSSAATASSIPTSSAPTSSSLPTSSAVSSSSTPVSSAATSSNISKSSAASSIIPPSSAPVSSNSSSSSSSAPVSSSSSSSSSSAPVSSSSSSSSSSSPVSSSSSSSSSSAPVSSSSSSSSSSTPVSSSSSSLSSSSLASSSATSSSTSSKAGFLRTDGAFWAKPDGTHITLKGTNLGNWLVQEYWMMGQGGNGVHDQCTLEKTLTDRFGYSEKERLMKLFHDSWITERDWDQLQAFGFNVVRLPFLWSVIEDEKNPKTLRADAWHYLDWAIAEAKKRNMYVILDLHGVVGGQTPNDHTGCSGQNKYWTTPEYQDRTKWLWEQVATKYKDEATVAAFDPYNEPWGSTAEDMAKHAIDLYDTIRKIDPDHIVLLHSHYGNIDVYGNPADKKMTNVAFQIHPYPGLFGDRPGDTHYAIHRDWLRCGPKGTDGVCYWNKKTTDLKTPLLIGEFQPWQGAGLDFGGQVGRATYDTYASYGWAATSWSYKLVSPAGGQGKGTWGMVTNAPSGNSDSGVGLVTKASTWDCAGWDSSFASACAVKAKTIKVGGTGSKTYYFVIKSGSLSGSNPDVTFDNISIINNTTNAELITNGEFGANNGWTTLSISGSEDINFNDNTAGKAPAGSSGAVLRITRPAGVTGEINGGVYQAITLEGGQTYTLSGVFKDNNSANTWAEMYLLDKEPTQGKDVIDMNGKVDFTTAPIEDIEKLYKSYATDAYDVHSGLSQWLVSAMAPDIFNLPARPTNLQIVEGSSSNTLTWNPVNNAAVTGYRVYRSTTSLPSGFKLLADNIATSTFEDTTPVANTTYYYAVSAITANDEGYMSDSVNTTINAISLPAKVEAEAFTNMSGFQSESCSEGGLDLGWTDAGDELEYKVNVLTTGDYVIDYRLATEPGSTGFTVTIDGNLVDTQSVPPTGGWQSWTTQTSSTISLTAGNHTLRIKAIGGSWNINWFEVKAK